MKYDKEHTEKIIEALQNGEGRVRACKAAVIDYHTFLDWLNEKKEFSDDVRKSEEQYNYRKINDTQRVYHERKSKKATNNQRQKETWYNNSYIYIVNQEDTEFYKIGVSKIKPYYRLSQLQNGNPYKLSIVHIFKTENPYMTEKAIHKRLDKYRYQREWFKISKNQVNKVIDIIEKEISNTHQLTLFCN
jgi:hypothetical protein